MSNQSDAQVLNIGTLVEKFLVDKEGNPLLNKEGKPIVDAEGNPVRVLELKLRQNVDIAVNGKTVDFKGYTIQGRDGGQVNLKSKVLNLTNVDLEISRLEQRVEEGKVEADVAESIKSSYERDNVLYTVKIASQNQA